ncbi:MAG: hypothetical protein IJ559_05480 [Prevotella sp.]|nr:hypothetical protein [Prevotella sp.]
MMSFDRIDFTVQNGGPGIDNPVGGDHGPSRAPMMPPYVGIEGHTLDFSCVGYDVTFYLLNEDEEPVFTLFIPAGTSTVELPSMLEGSYEICLVRGNWCFCGWIEL